MNKKIFLSFIVLFIFSFSFVYSWSLEDLYGFFFPTTTTTGGLRFCGNRICERGETAKDCPTDCEFFIQTSGGVSLHSALFLPASKPPSSGWPLVIFVPPSAGNKESFYDDLKGYAKDGYVGFSYTFRGRGKSGGEYNVADPDKEIQDLKDIITWLIKNVNVDPSNIGVTGGSMGGLHSWLIAVYDKRVKTIVPKDGPTDVYEAFIINDAIDVYALDNWKIYQKGPFMDQAVKWLEQGRLDLIEQELKRRSVRWRPETIKASVFGIDGWHDYQFVADQYLKMYQILNVPQRMLLTNGGHNSKIYPLNVERNDTYINEQRKKWFDYWLKGIDNGIMDEPPIDYVLPGTYEHYFANEWPPADTQYLVLYLQQNGALNANFPSQTGTDKLINEVPEIGSLNNPILNPEDIIYYTTEPLEEDLFFVGTPHVDLYISSNAREFIVTTRLYDVTPEGEYIFLTRAPFNSTNHIKNQVGLISYDLVSMGHRFKAGHKIGIGISNIDKLTLPVETDLRPAGDYAWTLPSYIPSEQTIYHTNDYPSNIVLPVIAYSPSTTTTVTISTTTTSSITTTTEGITTTTIPITTSTTIPPTSTTTTEIQCFCTELQKYLTENSCGDRGCKWYQIPVYRTCTPAGCDVEFTCVERDKCKKDCNEKCNMDKECKTGLICYDYAPLWNLKICRNSDCPAKWNCKCSTTGSFIRIFEVVVSLFKRIF